MIVAKYILCYNYCVFSLSVCTAGKMDCRIVWDKYENCFNHYGDGERPAGGMGKMILCSLCMICSN